MIYLDNAATTLKKPPEVAAAVVNAMRTMGNAERGIKISFAAPDAFGHVSPSAVAAHIRPDTRAIICTHASNLTGEIIDIEAVGRIAKEKSILFVVDASQTAGAVPIDMERMHIGILCFTGHKGLMGPQGTGGLCIAEGVEIRPFKTGGSGIHSFSKTQPEAYPTRLEAGTLNGHGIAGLGAAVDFILQMGVESIAVRETALMRRFYEGVAAIEGVKVYGDFSGRQRAAIVALNIGDMDSAKAADVLSEAYGIATRPGAHCAPRMHEALGTAMQGAVRFSFSYYSTEEEVDAAINAVKELAEG
ncbi:MAG: aminotransferase class V-fold PLP-dependent enzyme [Clostridiales bacterium]|nr:aminotransferase class V-fold PLP-dependent enzyme [Clostridiales bacterium]